MTGTNSGGGRALRAVAAQVLRAILRRSAQPTARQGPRRQPAPQRPAPPPASAGRLDHPASAYAGDATDVPALHYAPFDDDQADPGEIVWAWVPFEEDHSRGKDRPVLVVGRRQGLLLALMLTSKDHDRDQPEQARYGRHWVDIGTGAWDPQGRPSEVRVDRVLQLDPSAVRREGATLDLDRFSRVASAVREAHAGL